MRDAAAVALCAVAAGACRRRGCPLPRLLSRNSLWRVNKKWHKLGKRYSWAVDVNCFWHDLVYICVP